MGVLESLKVNSLFFIWPDHGINQLTLASQLKIQIAFFLVTSATDVNFWLFLRRWNKVETPPYTLRVQHLPQSPECPWKMTWAASLSCWSMELNPMLWIRRDLHLYMRHAWGGTRSWWTCCLDMELRPINWAVRVKTVCFCSWITGPTYTTTPCWPNCSTWPRRSTSTITATACPQPWLYHTSSSSENSSWSSVRRRGSCKKFASDVFIWHTSDTWKRSWKNLCLGGCTT